MKLLRRSTVVVLVVAVGCVGFVADATAAAPGTSNAVIADCYAHPGGLTGRYTVAELRKAIQVMPAEVKEYTSCLDVVNRALLAAIHPGKGGGSGGGSGSFLPTPVIVILVVLILIAVTFGAAAIRRRRGGGGPGAGGDGLS